MNYRHAFHVGNFADVLKHLTLARILSHLREKPAAFRVIDTHAGAGRYDLSGPEANRTGEWRNGIARVRAASAPAGVAALLAPYLEAISCGQSREVGGAGLLHSGYPGSPLIALRLMRQQDRLVACELEPSATDSLVRTIGGDRRAKAIAIDGYVGLNAYVPPKERRGLVLVDPPFERSEEFSDLLNAVVKAWRKWPNGIYMMWYPRKDRQRVAAFSRQLASIVTGNVLQVELDIGAGAAGEDSLAAAGLFIINPPWRLTDELRTLLDWLAPVLAQRAGFSHRLNWISKEK